MAEASSSFQLGNAGLRQTLELCPRVPAPPHVGLESWGEGSSGPQHQGAAESGRRQMERPVPGAGRGRSGLHGRGAGVVPVAGFGLRKGEMREGREGGQVVGGRAALAALRWWGGIGVCHHCFAPLPHTVREQVSILFHFPVVGPACHLLTGILF